MACPISKIHTTSDFEKPFRKLPIRIQNLAIKKDKWFRHDAFDRRLHTHKLKGELEGFWSYSINYEYRILFRFLNDNEVIYYDIGTHGIYK
jgi:mRNA-degrading endonuclease YafQ of YafQ-DinJ toxin-antitoxin module